MTGLSRGFLLRLLQLLGPCLEQAPTRCMFSRMTTGLRMLTSEYSIRGWVGSTCLKRGKRGTFSLFFAFKHPPQRSFVACWLRCGSDVTDAGPVHWLKFPRDLLTSTSNLRR